jgi:hypothetical protein
LRNISAAKAWPGNLWALTKRPSHLGVTIERTGLNRLQLRSLWLEQPELR